MDGVASTSSLLLDRLFKHAAEQSDTVAYTFLSDNGSPKTLTFAQLQQRVAAHSAAVRQSCSIGERAVLLYHPGLDFIPAFLGCMAAGVIAVPATPPRPRRKDSRLSGILADCSPKVILTTTAIEPLLVGDIFQNSNKPIVLATDEIQDAACDAIHSTDITADMLAVLQYTSGSTSSPKGVMLTHGNIAQNELQISECFGFTQSSIMLSWLPMFHDMGLFGGLLAPLWVGFPAVLLSPATFSRDPVRWLQAVTEYRATTTGAPNFAFDYCARRVTEGEKKNLDLSSLELVWNGAEPIRDETLDRFATAFSSCGYRASSMFPCYGLAESTLLVSGGPRGKVNRASVDGSHLEQGTIVTVAGLASGSRTIVSCGKPVLGTEVVIVDPISLAKMRPNQVGEVWLRSPAVGLGYWNRQQETAEVFSNYLANSNDGPYLATGDLGFSSNNELFITGRCKDLIIVRGRNLYPNDVELLVEKTVDFVTANTSAAFALETPQGESLGLAVETTRAHVVGMRGNRNNISIEPLPLLDAIARQLCEAIVDEFNVSPSVVLFLRPGAFPRTSSGKVQRLACKRLAISTSNCRDIVYKWSNTGNGRSPHESHVKGIESLEILIRDAVGRTFSNHGKSLPSDFDVSTSLLAIGVDSLMATELALELEKHTGVYLGDEILYYQRSIRDLATVIGIKTVPPSNCSLRPRAELRPSRTPLNAADLVDAPTFISPTRNQVTISGIEADRVSWETAPLTRFLRSSSTDLFCKAEQWTHLVHSMKRDRVWGFRIIRREKMGAKILVKTETDAERWVIDAASNDYLSLGRDPEVLEFASESVCRYGVSAQGASMLNGNTPLHMDLEKELCEFLGREAVILFPSGYSCMTATTQALLRPTDVVFADRFCHVSLMEGIHLSGSQLYRYPHNDVDALRRLLQEYRCRGNGALIVSDGVFSTDGSIAPVTELANVAMEFSCRLLIDDAHGIGTICGGRGCVSPGQADLLAGVFSKALGAGGGFLAGSRTAIDYIRMFGNAALNTSNLSTAHVAVGLAALRKIRANPSLIDSLATKTARLRQALRQNGLETGESVAPIISLICGTDANAYRTWRSVFENGVLAHALPFPVVPVNNARIRLRLTTSLSENDIDEIAAAAVAGMSSGRERVQVRGSSSTVMPMLTELGFARKEVSTRLGSVVAFERGSGPPIVFLHPVFWGSECYSLVMSEFDGPGRLIALEFPGHGTAPTASSPLSLDDAAGMLADILPAIGIEGTPITLVGTSMGGMIALRFAIAHSELINRLVLIGCSADAEESAAKDTYRSLFDVAKVLGSDSVISDFLISQFGSRYLESYPEVAESVRTWLSSRDLSTFGPLFSAVLERTSVTGSLRSIRCPTCIVVGDDDLAESVEHSTFLARGIDGAELVVVPECGHLVPIEKPTVIARQLY